MDTSSVIYLQASHSDVQQEHSEKLAKFKDNQDNQLLTTYM